MCAKDLTATSTSRLYQVAFNELYLIKAWLLAVSAFATMAIAMLNYYPDLSAIETVGSLGQDYPNFFVRMVSAEFLLRSHGLSELIWFTPAMCAGGFHFANPIDITYSLPQLISLFTNPVMAVYLTHIAMCAIGGLGTFLILRRAPFSVSIWPSLAAATVFSTNGFFMSRMIAGHLNFHTFMLIPLIVWCLLPGEKIAGRRDFSQTYRELTAGVLGALVVIGGGAHLVVPIAFGVLLVLICANRMSPQQSLSDIAASVLIASATAACLASAKLAAAYALESNFPRSFYELQGVSSIVEAIRLPIQNLLWFAHVPAETNGTWLLEPLEYEYSLSPFVLLGLIPAVFYSARRQPRLLLATSLCCMPVVLVVLGVTYYQADWHEVLNQVPIVASSVSLFRWYASFILVLCVVAALGLQRLPKGYSSMACAIVIIGSTSWQILGQQEWKQLDTIDYGPVLAGLRTSRVDGFEPISKLGVHAESDDSTSLISSVADISFTTGTSQIFCYEPIFGYAAEELRIDNLRVDLVTRQIGDELNMKNPACYPFPEANDCRAGDNFTIQQGKELSAFTHYQMWPFEIPRYQSLANKLALFGWLTFIALSLIKLLRVAGKVLTAGGFGS